MLWLDAVAGPGASCTSLADENSNEQQQRAPLSVTPLQCWAHSATVRSLISFWHRINDVWPGAASAWPWRWAGPFSGVAQRCSGSHAWQVHHILLGGAWGGICGT